MKDSLIGNCSIADATHSTFAFPNATEHYARDTLVQTEHVRLEVRPDFKNKKLYGKVSTRFRAKIGVFAVDFDAIELDIKSVKVGKKNLKFSQTYGKLSVNLGKEVKEGERFTIDIEYSCMPRRGIFFNYPDKEYPNRPIQAWTQGESDESRFWFPSIDDPNVKVSSEVIATVPKKFVAVSNGKLVSEKINRDGTKTFHWSHEIPHSVYLISLVAGEFSELKDSYDEIPLLYYVPKGREEDAKRTFANTLDMMKFFSKRLGFRYPYPKYSQVTIADFIFGGMENTSATTLTDSCLLDKRAKIDYNSDELIAHELAHQWFGDLITCRDWTNAWLNEGFATYFEALYHEYHLGADEFAYKMLLEGEEYFGEDRERYRRPIVTNVYEDSVELFDRHLYNKAALVLHMLRFVLGDDQFWRAIRYYVQKHKMQNVTTEDFRRAIEEATGRNLEPFFEQWFKKSGYPEFKVSYEWNESAKVAKVVVNQNQPTNGETPVFGFPVEIAIIAGKRKVHRVEIREKQQTFLFPLSEAPSAVEFDPSNWMLKTLEFARPKEMLLKILKESPAPVEKIRAVQELSKLGTQEIVDELRSVFFKERFWAVQSRIAQALGQIRSKAALRALLQCLSVKHPKARRGVVRALGEFRDEEAAAALIRVLKYDRSYFVEMEAAISLGKTKSQKAFDALKKSLEKESFNEVIRVGVFQGFEALRDERAIPIAMEWSRYGKPQKVREAAVGVLGKIARGKPDVLDFLHNLLYDYWWRVKMYAISSIEEFRDTRSLGELYKLVERELEGRVKRRAKEAIKKIREDRDRTREFKALRDDLDKLKEDDRKLRDRLDLLETKLK
ncbi:MAG: peptidase M1 [Thaumarchaeota archaeon]|nr:peptidase M1 [Nitrososphaerota archaeon]